MRRNVILYVLVVLFTVYEAMVFESLTPSVLLVFELILGAAMLLSGFYQSRVTRLEIDVAEADFSAGEPGTLRLLATNASPWPMVGTEICLEVQYVHEGAPKRRRERVTLAPKAVTEIELEMNMPYCGRARANFLYYRVTDCLGIFSWKRKWKQSLEFQVQPKPVFANVEELKITHVIGQDGTLYHTNRSGHDHSEIYQVRDYQEGDRLAAVHWKLSAKQDDLIVKEFSLPKKSSYLLLFDGRCRTQKEFHRRVVALLSISRTMMAQGCVHTVAWFDYQSGAPSEQMIQEWEDYDRVQEMLPGVAWSASGEFPLAVYERFYPQVQYVKAFFVTGRFQESEANLLDDYRGAVKKSLILLDETRAVKEWRDLEILRLVGADLEKELETLPVLLSV